MGANPNWARWSFATMSKHFQDALNAVTPPIPLYPEGDERKTEDLKNYCEFRMDGPIMEETSKDWWHLELVVNILIVNKLDDQDFHYLHQMCGIVSAACNNGITAFKYGNGPDDDPTVTWGCYILDKRRGDNIVISHIGQVHPELRDRRAAVEVFYCMTLASDNSPF